MIVTHTAFDEVIKKLKAEPRLALDTETTGLRMYHGHKFFSIIISNQYDAYYFNFNRENYTHDEESKPTITPNPEEIVMGPANLSVIDRELFKDQDKLWFIQNAANFDLPVLGVEGLELYGTIHCTKAIGRVEHNNHLKYGLMDQLARLGQIQKSDAVKEYIDKHKLYTKLAIPGKSTEDEWPHFDQVPLDIIVPYAETDALGTFFLGKMQLRSIEDQDDAHPNLVRSGRSLKNVVENERRLQKTIFNMKHRGVLIDKNYCTRARAYELDRERKAAERFKRETGREYISSPKLFAEVFAEEKDRWSYTDKGNPSFDYDALKKLKSPAAVAVVEMRDAKSKADFYNGFLYFADREGVVHPNLNPEGAAHGRFSSSEPNFQNLTSEAVATCKACQEEIETVVEECPKCKSKDLNFYEYTVRRAIIPRPGYVLIMPDYDQMEYKFMLEMACRLVQQDTELSKLIRDGMDFHDATALKVKNYTSLELPRKQVKIVNFMTLYGSGVQNMADTLGVYRGKAYQIREAILNSSKEIRNYIETVSATAEQRGWIVNWLGRRCHFPDKRYAYKAPNYHTSGGCADVVKVAMNKIDHVLSQGFKSRMIMSVHDELPIEIHENEVNSVPHLVKEIMETAFTSKYVPLTTGMEWSDKSLGDKRKGFPV